MAPPEANRQHSSRKNALSNWQSVTPASQLRIATIASAFPSPHVARAGPIDLEPKMVLAMLLSQIRGEMVTATIQVTHIGQHRQSQRMGGDCTEEQNLARMDPWKLPSLFRPKKSH